MLALRTVTVRCMPCAIHDTNHGRRAHSACMHDILKSIALSSWLFFNSSMLLYVRVYMWWQNWSMAATMFLCCSWIEHRKWKIIHTCAYAAITVSFLVVLTSLLFIAKSQLKITYMNKLQAKSKVIGEKWT